MLTFDKIRNPFLRIRTFNTREAELRGPRGNNQELPPFHSLRVEDVVKYVRADVEKGLGDEQVQARLEEHGSNVLGGDGGVTPWTVLLRQLMNALTLVLVIAAVSRFLACRSESCITHVMRSWNVERYFFFQAISFITQDWIEAGVILFVIVFNTLIGFLQEYRAERTMESLRQTASPTARVIRKNLTTTIPARDLVPGDIILVEQGDSVPGDARLLRLFNLEVDEAMLTGESVPVEKSVDVIRDPNQPLADRNNMIYLGTIVTKGRGRAVVVATGMKTQMGRIAKSLVESSSSTTTPLQKRLNRLALILFGLALILAVVVFAAHHFHITTDAAIYAVSVGIAMIPEGLVAVVTLTMALGVRRMAKQKAIVRQLAALETLGATTDICSDKTGTLTQGKMVLTRFWIPGDGYFDADGAGLCPIGKVVRKDTGDPITSDNMSNVMVKFVECAALCNTSEIREDEAEETGERWIGSGDPSK